MNAEIAVSLKKYWKILRISLVERMVYRADFLLSTVLRFLPVVTTILLWQAVYAGAGPDADLEGYRLNDMIAYLLSYRAAHKLTYIVATSLPYALLFFLCRDAFESMPDAGTWVVSSCRRSGR